MKGTLLHLAWTFGWLSMLSVGGGSSLLPEMQKQCVLNGWIDAEGFSESYSLGQIIPGPPMTMVGLLGYHAAGLAGAAVVLVAFFLPPGLLVFAVHRLWARLSGWRWRPAIQAGVAPISVGLLLAGAVAIAQGSVKDGLGIGLVVLSMALSLWKGINPALLVLGCGVLKAIL